ncbi:MAG TPA: polyprenyl synthetase family protein [Tepidisphaeraceae bacterium]|jgi:geranylgeranyl pyrophosphate synthase|nr:polyprenyl synthetase family protein [Tepidisphaeraceae bacterium]
MQIPVLKLPRAVPPERVRPPQTNIPQSRGDREEFKQRISAYVEKVRPVPPLSLEELRRHSGEFLRLNNLDPQYRDYVAIVLNSEVWKDSLAAVPFERRLLLLPKCLRVEDKCPAPFDDFGLLCKQCGLCSIQDLQVEAERLGYAVLVAEGSALVMAIIQTGKIDAIVGVSCLSVLEKAFPYMESAAIPGVAIPLLQDDCKDTTIDLDWVWDVIHLTGDDKTHRLNLDDLRREVDSWFEAATLDKIAGKATTQTEQIAREWLIKDGKRWRPFLAACAYKAFQDDPKTPLPIGLKKLCVAVECFHKASLAHDDIEDNDALRYGEQTLHEKYGVPVALNAGDLLIGDGYRLIAECGAAPEATVEMIRIAAEGHRTLSIGQGAELCWARAPQPLPSLAVLDIFAKKTAPAFEVALRLGATFAGADQDVADVLARYSEALGIAYQIRDDIEDLTGKDAEDDIAAQRPSLPLALAFERTTGADKALVESVWRRAADAQTLEKVRALIGKVGAEDRCRGLLDSYKEEAVRSLGDLENASLKGLLRRVIGKIFAMEVQGWCSEFEARNAPGREVGAQALG